MEIVPGVHWIPQINGNVYVLVGDTLTLIDTGLPHNTKKILSYITETLKRKPEDVSTIILTHAHIDHIGNVAELHDVTGAKIAAHQADANFMEKKQTMPPSKSLMIRVVSPLIRVKPFTIDIRLTDGSQIAGTHIYHTPGHTPGSIAILKDDASALFIGDTILTPNATIEGPSERFTLDYTRAMESVHKIARLTFNVLLSGHGDPVLPNAAEKVRQRFPQ